LILFSINIILNKSKQEILTENQTLQNQKVLLE